MGMLGFLSLLLQKRRKKKTADVSNPLNLHRETKQQLL